MNDFDEMFAMVEAIADDHPPADPTPVAAPKQQTKAKVGPTKPAHKSGAKQAMALDLPAFDDYETQDTLFRQHKATRESEPNQDLRHAYNSALWERLNRIRIETAKSDKVAAKKGGREAVKQTAIRKADEELVTAVATAVLAQVEERLKALTNTKED